MKKYEFEVGQVELSDLQTEEGIQREAQRLLPKVLVQLGEKAGEQAWDEFQKALKGPGVALNKSAIEKRKHITDSGKEYAKTADAFTRKEVVDAIIEDLRRIKAEQSSQKQT